mmetsp:Transcript_25581/g.64569  ORF Transcript_25581/g.64569 Transcript_25581/m.64569 type:complete len:208 (+) Transcript_25581:775-1398(+)
MTMRISVSAVAGGDGAAPASAGRDDPRSSCPRISGKSRSSHRRRNSPTASAARQGHSPSKAAESTASCLRLRVAPRSAGSSRPIACATSLFRSAAPAAARSYARSAHLSRRAPSTAGHQPGAFRAAATWADRRRVGFRHALPGAGRRGLNGTALTGRCRPIGASRRTGRVSLLQPAQRTASVAISPSREGRQGWAVCSSSLEYPALA